MDYATLKSLKPSDFEDAADGYQHNSNMARAAKDRINNQILTKIRQNLDGEASTAAIGQLKALSRNFHYAQVECGMVSTALNAFSHDIRAAKKKLNNAVADAEAEKFTVNSDGTVTYPASSKGDGDKAPGGTVTGREKQDSAGTPLNPADPNDTADAIDRQADNLNPNSNPHRANAQEYANRIANALKEATEADAKWSPKLERLQADDDLTVSHADWNDTRKDADAIRKGNPRGKTALELAMRLQSPPDGVESINISETELQAVNRAARETNISKKLLLAILWQEQQWYQKVGSLDSPAVTAGRIFNWSLAETVKPDKSLGITHIKPETARKILDEHPNAFPTQDGGNVNDLNDSQLNKYIEERPDEAIRMAAYHLRDTREKSSHGADSDRDLFILYAADTPEVREMNEKHGDDSSERGDAIKARIDNWNKIESHLDDSLEWNRLTEEERSEAREQLESQTPAGHNVSIEPIIRGPLSGNGTAPPEPGTPAPSPGPSPNEPTE